MKTEKYEFYHQSKLIQIGNLIDDLHHVHVHLLKLQRRYYRIYGKYASFARICGHITKLKQRTKPHWNQLPSQVIQQVAKRIHLGYETFFDNIKDRKAGKTKRKVGRPKIKPNHKYNSLTFTQAGFKIEGNRLYIGCLKKSFTFWEHRAWTGTVKTVTIKRDPVGDYYLYLTCEDCESSEKLPLTGNVAGADFGCKHACPFQMETRAYGLAFLSGYASTCSRKAGKLLAVNAVRLSCLSRLMSSMASRRGFMAVRSAFGKRSVRVKSVFSILICRAPCSMPC